ARIVDHLSAAGFDAVALELPGHLGKGGDVDDLHRLVGDEELADALANLPVRSDEDSEDDVVAVLRALPENASYRVIEDAVRQFGNSLNGADRLRRQLLRDQAITLLKERTSLKAPAMVVDAVLKNAATQEDGNREELLLREIEPHEDPIEGDALLDELRLAIRRFLVLGAHTDTAIALWTIHAHAHDSSPISPVLGFVSPEKRCGKTTALEVVQALAPRPLPVANITPAAMFRVVEIHRPTLLIDEADTYFRDNDELRGVINSGH
ncbi:unnamed protein product, partial [marine sediment metagenome]